MEKGKKVLFILLVLAMTVSMLVSACSTPATTPATAGTTAGTETTASETTAAPNSLPLVDEPLTFTVWATANTAFPATGLQSYNDVLCFQELEKRTGVHIEWTLPSQAQATDSFNLMISSGEYKDMMLIGPTTYTGGVDKAIDDGVFLRLNDLIAQNAPNFSKILASDAAISKNIITDSGNIAAFCNIDISNQPPFVGPMVRTDWLEALNIPVPQTIDDFTAMLQKFKTEKNAFFYLARAGMDMGIMGAYGLTGNLMTGAPEFRQIDGVVSYSGSAPELKGYLTTLNQWYTAGLIDKDFYTRIEGFTPDMSVITTDQVSAITTVHGFMGFFEAQMQDKNARWNAVPYPVVNAGDKIHVGLGTFRPGSIGGMAISTTCKNPEIATKWMDYMYSDEGALLMNYGIEGTTFNMVDGKPMLSDLILNNPDGKNTEQALYSNLTDPGWPKIYDWTRGYQGPSSARQLVAADTWMNDGQLVLDWTMPVSLTLTAEEGAALSAVMGDINTYASEMIIKFIIGVEPLDKFDAYVSQIDSMGIAQAISIEQAALDRFNAR